MRLFKRILCSSLLACVAIQAQERNGLDVQKARSAHVAGRAKRVYYTHSWDLSGLPEYKPTQVVSGTIREWGSNYSLSWLLVDMVGIEPTTSFMPWSDLAAG